MHRAGIPEKTLKKMLKKKGVQYVIDLLKKVHGMTEKEINAYMKEINDERR